MVGEAVAEYKNGIIENAADEVRSNDCRVELPITAHLSHEYVPGERLRLDVYRRLADSASMNDVNEIEKELVDRFGELPEPARELMSVAQLRVMAKALHLHEVVVQGNYLRISEVELPESVELRLMRLYPGSQIKKATRTLLVARPRDFLTELRNTNGAEETSTDRTITEWAMNVLHEISGKRVNT